MESNVTIAAFTVRVAFPEALPEAAVMVAEPAPTDVASPALLIVAIDISEELHVTCVVRSCLLLSEKIPVAVNCCLVPRAMLGFVGVTSMETNVTVAAFTVRVVLPEIAPDVAVIVVEPSEKAVASPLEPTVSLTVAMAGLKELHVTDDVRSFLVLSEYIPVALNCWVVPIAMDGLVGVTSMDASAAGVVP